MAPDLAQWVLVVDLDKCCLQSGIGIARVALGAPEFGGITNTFDFVSVDLNASCLAARERQEEHCLFWSELVVHALDLHLYTPLGELGVSDLRKAILLFGDRLVGASVIILIETVAILTLAFPAWIDREGQWTFMTSLMALPDV